METATIHGDCDRRFLRVKEAFAANFASGGELGAAVAVTIDGEPVVDLWGGIADKASGKAWEKDTLVNVFSTTKGVTAICAHRLVEDGLLDLDAPVAKLWPEFAAAAKESVTLRHLLSHRAGLPAIASPLPPEAMYDWDVMTGALAAQAPWWEPGTKHGYHAMTFGWLVGELIRRASGKTVGTYLRETITGPLALDLHIGLDARDDARCAELRPGRRMPDQRTLFDQILEAPDSLTAKAFTNPFTMMLPSAVSSRIWRATEIPALNGHATARALARLYGVLACGGTRDGTRVMSAESIARASEEHSVGADEVLPVSTRFGLGFMLPQPHDVFGGPRAFGHPGAGGSVAFADPEKRLGFSYVMNRMGTNILVDPRAQALSDATYASL